MWTYNVQEKRLSCRDSQQTCVGRPVKTFGGIIGRECEFCRRLEGYSGLVARQLADGDVEFAEKSNAIACEKGEQPVMFLSNIDGWMDTIAWRTP
jgi:hypothetical protein